MQREKEERNLVTSYYNKIHRLINCCHLNNINHHESRAVIKYDTEENQPDPSGRTTKNTQAARLKMSRQSTACQHLVECCLKNYRDPAQIAQL